MQVKDPFNGIAFPGVKRDVREWLSSQPDPYKALVRYLMTGKLTRVESDKPVSGRDDSCGVYWHIGRAIVELGRDSEEHISKLAKAAGYSPSYLKLMADTYKFYPDGVPGEIKNTIELRENLKKYRDIEEGFAGTDCKSEAARLLVKFRGRFDLQGQAREHALEKMKEALKYPDPFAAFLSLMVKGRPIESAHVTAPEAPFKGGINRDVKAFKWHLGRALYELQKFDSSIKFDEICRVCGIGEGALDHYLQSYMAFVRRKFRQSDNTADVYEAACQELSMYATRKGKPVPNKVIDTVAEAYGISPNGLKNHWANYCKEKLHPSLQAVIEMYEQKVSELQRKNDELMEEIGRYRERLARASELLQQFENTLKIA
jgi:hypothetical protein